MKTSEFLGLIANNPNKALLFEYRQGEYVPAAYHITEVKNVHIESVDCGGRAHSSQQTIVQLWHNGKETGTHMAAKTAKKIMDEVEAIKPMRKDTELFFEYGNAFLNTSNYRVERIIEEETQIKFQLFVEPVACKPILELNILGQSGNVCGIDSGCC